MKGQNKRNHSDLSDCSTPSPTATQQSKSCKMSLDKYFTQEVAHTPDDETADLDSVLDDQVKSLSMEQKIDSMYKMMKIQEVKTRLDISSLQAENKQLQLKLQQSNGIIGRLASKVSSLEEKVQTLETHSMKKNLVIYNLPEKPGEDVYKEVRVFFEKTLKIPDAFIFSSANLGAEIRMDVTHRMGQKSARPRPVVVSFTSQQGKNLVMSYSSNLKSTPYAISEHLPSSVRERRTAQIPLMVKMRQESQNNNSDARIKLIKDKLYVNNHHVKGKFESNALDYHTNAGDTIDFDNIRHTPPEIVKNSIFQGHYHPIHTQAEACSVLRALYQGEIAKSDHLIYAYRFIDADGHTVSGYEDDGEWSASEMLHELLQENNINRGILIVSRTYGGQNLGKQRFDIIRQVAKEALPK